jgi:hypothetical protein
MMRSLVALAVLLVACGSPDMTRDLALLDFDMATTMPGGDGGIACGPGDCLIGGDQVCCLDNALRYCAPASACSTGIPVYCDGPEDCPGAVCCQPPAMTAIVCITQCNGTVLCHSDGDCPSAQPRCCPDRVQGFAACATGC